MGLCKCPKRRVTNQFCFEHRVNVCEHCMVTNHPKCVVQSYLQWLQDSDYNPICEICTKNLVEQECIRLVCYHVFHWGCAENHFRSLPRTTAPAGYKCPSCTSPVFPPPNLVSPVADVLREKLAGVNWARAALGLPLLSDEQDMKVSSSLSSSSDFYNDNVMGGVSPQRGTPVGASDDESTPLVVGNGNTHSIVHIQDDGIYDSTSRRNDTGNQSRKIFNSLESSKKAKYDVDENKYKGKPTFAWIVRWWKNSLPTSRSRFSNKRNWLIVLFVVGAVVVLYYLSHMDRNVEEDPFGSIDDSNSRILQKN